MTPEARARMDIDRLLTQAGWQFCDYKAADLQAARGVAIREFPLGAGYGAADYLLYVDGKAAGIGEAKKRCAVMDFCRTLARTEPWAGSKITRATVRRRREAYMSRLTVTQACQSDG